jgi:hypothetical protein
MKVVFNDLSLYRSAAFSHSEIVIVHPITFESFVIISVPEYFPIARLKIFISSL